MVQTWGLFRDGQERHLVSKNYLQEDTTLNLSSIQVYGEYWSQWQVTKK